MQEIRFSELSDIETRDDSLEISGYAIVFNEPSVTLGGANGFKEIIKQSALDDVDLSDVYLLNQHRSDGVLGNTSSGTLNLSLTERGLFFSANLPDTQLGRDSYKLIKRGDLKSMSFAFTVSKDSWNVQTSPEIRTVEKISELRELSLVTFPAYEQSNVSTRSMEFLQECRECRFEMKLKETNVNDMLTSAQKLLDEVK